MPPSRISADFLVAGLQQLGPPTNTNTDFNTNVMLFMTPSRSTWTPFAEGSVTSEENDSMSFNHPHRVSSRSTRY
jgi:hypothetical protein